jgi:hypothetical protein
MSFLLVSRKRPAVKNFCYAAPALNAGSAACLSGNSEIAMGIGNFHLPPDAAPDYNLF